MHFKTNALANRATRVVHFATGAGLLAAGGFEVRELQHGTSNISFDYRIVAKRRGYESVRLEDITDRMDKMRQHEAEMQARRAGSKISAPPVPAAPQIAAGSAPAPR
jgi:hypothetical protein